MGMKMGAAFAAGLILGAGGNVFEDWLPDVRL